MVMVYENFVCGRCGKSLGALTQDEFVYLANDEDASGLCFDCDGNQAEDVSVTFRSFSEGEYLKIDDCYFRYQHGELIPVDAHDAHAHDAGAHSYLSSTALFNKNSNARWLLRELLTFWTCEVCQGKELIDELGVWQYCYCCDGKGWVARLPEWIMQLINGVRQHA